jgi:hypothetical protein
MTRQMHAELMALCRVFYSEGISEEEWALLQIHMAYCEGCHWLFVALQQTATPGTP